MCIADELLIKLGIRISPRTVGHYMPGHDLAPVYAREKRNGNAIAPLGL
jgi:hypothetical protein